MGKPISDSIEVFKYPRNQLLSQVSNSQITTDVLLIDKKIEFNNSELSGLRNLRLPSLSAYGVYGTTGFGTTGK